MHLCKLVLKRLRRKGTSGGRSPWDPSFSWPGALQFVCPVVDVRHGAALRWAQLYNKNTPQGCVPCGPMYLAGCAHALTSFEVPTTPTQHHFLCPCAWSLHSGQPVHGWKHRIGPRTRQHRAGRECVGEWVRVLGTQPCAFNVFLEANCLSVGRSRVLEFAALSLLYTCVRSLLSSLGASSGLAGLSLPFSSAASQVRAAAAAAACAQSPCF
eukprot:scaffold163471_cov21-Tisochrysis_lutea.AAC.2